MADTSDASDGRGNVRVERGEKRIRAMLAGVVVADTARPILVWEKPYHPTYYVPADDVRTDLLHETGSVRESPSRGDGTEYAVRAGGAEAEAGAYRHADSPIKEIRDAYAFDFDAMDHWFEEDEEIHTHPRDPYTRVDILASSRHVEIRLDGTTVADSHSPTLLFETGLPVRFYLPKPHVRMDLLTPSDTETHCPYKGVASYWSVEIDGERHDDIAWSYPFPAPESTRIAGLVCFYDERVDVVVDGELQDRPKTKFA